MSESPRAGYYLLAGLLKVEEASVGATVLAFRAISTSTLTCWNTASAS